MSAVVLHYVAGKLIPPKGYKLNALGEKHTFQVHSSGSRKFRVDPDNYRFLEKS